MKTRGLHTAVLAFAVAFSGCTSLGSYPSEWHGTSDAIHVYVADAATAIEIPATGRDVTVLDAVLHVGLPAGDLTYKDVLKVHPFGNTIATVDLTGKEVMDYLAVIGKMTAGSGAFPQFAGMALTIEGGSVRGVSIQGVLYYIHV